MVGLYFDLIQVFLAGYVLFFLFLVIYVMVDCVGLGILDLCLVFVVST